MVTRVKPQKADQRPQNPEAHSLPEQLSHAVAGALGLHGERMSKVDTA
jgi:hypothetical protein